MSRRRVAKKTPVLPDARYNSLHLAKMINYVMLDGKKSIAESIVYDAVEALSESVGEDVSSSFSRVLENVRPVVEVRSRRIGGANYQVPVDVRESRAISLAMRWLIDAARRRADGRTMGVKLASELKDAYAERGAAVKKRDDVHKMAEANRALAHYKW